MYNETGTVFNMQRFSTSDGPGIRTVVFLKGCPLNCAWCHNPESKRTATEILYKPELCIGCGACHRVCAHAQHTFADGAHRFERSDCVACTACVDACCANALERCGEQKTVDEVIRTVCKDEVFYRESGGGMTLSGGEPLLQFDFSLALLRAAKEHGLHTAIETCGYTQQDIAALHPYTDLWLYDIKVFPEEEHIQYTGVSNQRIFENLQRLNDLGANIILRCPIIPDVNLHTAHFEALAALATKLDRVFEIHLEPYHPLGMSKAKQLDRPQAYQNDTFLDAAALTPFVEHLRERTATAVVVL